MEDQAGSKGVHIIGQHLKQVRRLASPTSMMEIRTVGSFGLGQWLEIDPIFITERAHWFSQTRDVDNSMGYIPGSYMYNCQHLKKLDTVKLHLLIPILIFQFIKCFITYTCVFFKIHRNPLKSEIKLDWEIHFKSVSYMQNALEDD